MKVFYPLINAFMMKVVRGIMRIIFTRKGEPILIDDEDYERLNEYTWHLDKDGYAVTSTPKPRAPGKPTLLFMHRLVMGLEYRDSRKVDHIHHRKTDNRKSELRVCSNQQNGFNSKRLARNTSGFKGVSPSGRPSLPWRAAIRYNGKSRNLGNFETVELAHEFYCLAADLLFGDFANYGGSHECTTEPDRSMLEN